MVFRQRALEKWEFMAARQGRTNPLPKSDGIVNSLADAVEFAAALRSLNANRETQNSLSPDTANSFPCGRYLELQAGEQNTAGRFDLDFGDCLRRMGVTVATIPIILAAFIEMRENALEHAQSPVTPVATWEVGPSGWEFSVTDAGVGVLASLRRNPVFSNVASGTEAIRRAIEPGVSGTALVDRGNGFNAVFERLAHRRSLVLVRSDDAMYVLPGDAPTRLGADLVSCSRRIGFHVRVRGRAGS